MMSLPSYIPPFLSLSIHRILRLLPSLPPQGSDMVNMDSLHAVVVPLEPSVTAGYHPCFASDLQRELLYSPPLGLLIRESPQLPDVLTAAMFALFTESVLKVMVIFFFIGAISGTIIWLLGEL